MKVKTRTIYMLIAILIVMVSAYLLDEWYRFERNSQLLRRDHEETVTKFYHGVGKRTEAVLQAESSLILRDKKVLSALKSGDRDQLLKIMRPYKSYMKAVFPGSMTILNFYKPDGTLYLMVDNPKRFGVNNSAIRPILLSVVKTRKAVTGIELCSASLSQRYITPVYDGKELLGVLEVSSDLDFIAKRIASISNIKTVILLDSMAYDRMKKAVHVTYSDNYFNNSDVPYDVLRDALANNRHYLKSAGSEYEIIKSFPITAYKKGQVGSMYFISKTGGLESWFREHIARSIMICFIGVLLIVFVSRNGFIESISELEKEHDKALSDLKKINSDLEDRVQRELDNCRRKDQIINQQQKVADMGMMLSALAHHWRQPINAVGLYVQDLSEAYRSGELTKDYIDEFEHNNMSLLTKLSDSIDKYRSFFEPSTEKTKFEITVILTEVAEILNATLSSAGIKLNICCKCDSGGFECAFYDKVPKCENKLTEITGFLNEFKQTLLNIIYNSIDAITSRYKREGAPGHDGLIRISISVVGDDILIDVEDNGTGIPEGIIDKVFNPFFTTKDEGMGTGIGLYMAKTVIEKYMCGTISAENSGHGAILHIILNKNCQCL